MKGLIEQAVIVGCDVDHCSKLLIFNRGIDRDDLDGEIRRAGWLPLPLPAGDQPFQQEHACPAHADELDLTITLAGTSLADLADLIHAAEEAGL